MNFKQHVWPVLSLTIISVAVAAVLALTNNLTKDIILQQEIDAANAAKLEVLPEADGFEVIELNESDKTAYNVTDVVSARNGAGTVITLSSAGYGGQVPVMVGFDANGNITRIKVMENSETPGIGKKTEDEAYWGQYNGLGADLSSVKPITGATVSSTSVKTSVENAFKVYEIVKGGN